MIRRLKNLAPLLGLLAGILMPLAAFGQATLLPNAVQQYFDANGDPVSSGTVDYYIPNTTTRKNTWRDAEQTQLNPNPVPLTAGGFPDTNGAGTYGTGSYRQVLKDVNGNTIWDAVTSATGSGGGGGGATYVTDVAPVGSVIWSAGLTAPANYIAAYGQAISRVTYAELYAATTITTTGTCLNGSAVIGGLSDTTQIKVGAAIEAACLPPGSTVSTVSNATTIVASQNATTTAAVSFRFFPYGNGDGATTFNVVDMRGKAPAGRPNLGGTDLSNLTSTYCGTPSGQVSMGSSCGSQSLTLVNDNLPHLTPAVQGSTAHVHTETPGVPSSTTATAAAGGTVANLWQGLQSGSTGSSSLGGLFVDIGGNPQVPASQVQPTMVLNAFVKYASTTPGGAVGVLSIGGMVGDILCGAGLTCAGQTISADLGIDWQVPQYNVPIGLGSPNTGFDSTAPSAAGNVLASNGPTSNPSFQPIGPIFDGAFCSTQGAILTRNATDWVCLNPGTSGQTLTSAGAGANLTWAGFTVSSDLNMNGFRIENLSNGSAGDPAISAQDADTGLSFGAGEIDLTLNGVHRFGAFDTGSDQYFGISQDLTAIFPPCRMDMTGGGLLRCYKVIISQPGDTPEYGYYAVAGSTAAPTHWAANNQGNQMSISYTLIGAPEDGNPSNLVLANSYRLILPCLLGAGPGYTCTRYQPSASGYVDGMTFQLKFDTAASAATPTLNWNGWGVRNVYRADCTTVPGASYWNLDAEISVTYVAATTRFCATADSDLPAGRTDRAAFANPNWARSTNTVTRMTAVPGQTSRAASFGIETTLPGQTVLRTRMAVSEIGSTVILARGSYEDGPTANGLDQIDYYPGPMANSPTDCYYYGQYFAGLCGPRNSFNTAGWASLSVVASDRQNSWPAVGIRKSTEPQKGVDYGIDFSTDRFLTLTKWPTGGSNAIATLTEANGRCRVTTAAPHGRSRYQMVTTSGYVPTGDDTPNGAYTIWPVSTTEFELLGSKCANSYGAGGVYDTVSTGVVASINPQNNRMTFGGNDGSHSLAITTTASQVNAFEITGAITASEPTLLATGSDTNVSALYNTKGTGVHRFFTGSAEQVRINHTASAVNYVGLTGAATAGNPSITFTGSDTNVSGTLITKGTGNISLSPGGTESLRATRVASAVNYVDVYGGATGTAVQIGASGSDTNISTYLFSKGNARIEIRPGNTEVVRIPSCSGCVNVFELKGSTTGNPVVVEAGGSDANVDLQFTPRGSGNVRFGTHTASGDVAMSGYITIKDAAGNTRKLMVCSAC